MKTTETLKKVVVLLIEPSQYDRNGNLIQYRRGVVPTESTSALCTLTQEAFDTSELSGIPHEIVCFHEILHSQKVNPTLLMAQYQRPGIKVVVGLVGVQTRQFARARDLGREFIHLGATVVIGGFHVSSPVITIENGRVANIDRAPCPERMSREIQNLMDEGFIVFTGEAERVKVNDSQSNASWHQVLCHIVESKAQRLYHGGMADVSQAPTYQPPPGYIQRFAGDMRTVQISRGCPFTCDFCSIWPVLGNDMRARDPQAVLAWVRKLCQEVRHAWFFITDDNFARNPVWRAILEGLIKLRAELAPQGRTFSFLVEIDLASYKIQNFVELLGAAGCRMALLGVESLNRETLQASSKGQNRPDHYAEFFSKLRANGILVHALYIFGFDADNPKNIAVSVKELKALGVDVASFFILTPIPGSPLRVRMLEQNKEMDPDPNNYDSFSTTVDHPQMPRHELLKAYTKAWREFYRSAYMIEALKGCQPETYWWLFRNFIWLRNSINEGTHPMNCGFWRIRSRVHGRRPGHTIDTVLVHVCKEVGRRVKYLGRCVGEFFIFEHVYFQSRLKPQLESRLSKDLGGFRDWFARTFKLPATRVWLNRFWIRYASQKWHLLWKWYWHAKMVPCAFTEIVFMLRFAFPLIKGIREMV